MFDSIFAPSFGNRPRTLVGRDAELQAFQECLTSKPGSRERVILLLGQRGSGKTVLLLELADLARKQGYVVASPTVTSSGMLERILEKLLKDGESYIVKEKRKISGATAGALGFSAGVQFEEGEVLKKSFAFRLSELCDTLEKKERGILILVDEVQANNEELKQLIIAYQEMVGEGRNIAIVMAGLPGAISSTLNDHVLTFLNRASKITLHALRKTEIERYYRGAFAENGVKITEYMCAEAAKNTKGSPYLMQLVGHYITKYSSEEGDIDQKAFDEAILDAREDYINDICITTLHRLSDKDIAFLETMVLDSGVSKISDIAERMNVSSAYAQLYRRRLLDTGIIEQVRRGQVMFAVPYMKEYLLREQE